MNYGRRYSDEDLDMYFSMHLTTGEFAYILGYKYYDPKIKNYGQLTGIYDPIDNNNAFNGKIEIKADEKTMRKTSTTPHELFTNSELNEILGFTKNRYPAGTQLDE